MQVLIDTFAPIVGAFIEHVELTLIALVIALAIAVPVGVLLARNIVVGLNGLDPAIVEAARGMGMNDWQRFRQVELPLALPLILAGVRLATLSIIAIATVAALVGAGGLGTPLLIGVTTGGT